MQPSMQLFYLIRSLDASEVKYVRAFAKRKVADGTASLELFDLIHRCKEYDENLFAKKVAVSNFPALKVYVRDLIADAILEKETKKKGAAEVMALIGQMDIFHKKGFKQLMWARMEKALELCERYELFHLHRELLQKKQSIVMLDVPSGHTPEAMEGFDDAYSEVKRKFKNLEDYIDLEERVITAARKGNTAMFEVATELLEHPLLADGAPLLSIRAEIKYCFVKRNILRWTNRPTEALKYSERIVAILDANPRLMVDESNNQMYVSRIYNIGWYAAATGAIDQAAQTIERLQSLAAYPILIFERVHSIELRMAMHQLDLSRGEEVITKIAEGLKTYEFRLNYDRVIAYYFQIAHFYLYFAEAKKALKWVQRLREADPAPFRKDLQNFGEILHLVSHFDLGNYKFLKNEAIKVKGYLQKNESLTTYEDTIIKGLRLAAIAKSESIRSKRLMNLGKNFSALKAQPEFEYRAYYFQFDLWITSKLSGGYPAKHLLTSPDRIS